MGCVMKSFKLTEEEVREMTKRVPTPFMVVSVEKIAENYRFMRQHMPRVGIYYAIKANPEYKEAKIALAITYSEIGRYKEAMALYEELIKEENANEEVWYNLGNIYYYNQGDSNKAEECYLKATEINNKLYI